jgi:phage/plasmid primase-like uncharacterized protein
MQIRELLALARGQWREILIDAGMPADSLSDRRGRPCPRCGGRDRFTALDVEWRGTVHCRRCFSKHSNPRPGDGLDSLSWFLGVPKAEAIVWLKKWLGIVDGQPIPKVIEPRPIEPKPERSVDPQMSEDAERWFAAMKPQWRSHAAELLGISAKPLERLRVGWAEEYRATTWPMRDPDGRVVGIRLRCPTTARKWAVRGSRAGLFYPCDQKPESVLFVAEGPTDTAAVLSLGLRCVGVPSAGGCVDWLVDFIRRIESREVFVIADSDEPGMAGADRVVMAVQSMCSVNVIHPPAKDAREWIVSGLGVEDLQSIGGVKR